MTSVLDRLPLRTRLVAGTVLLVAIGLVVAGVAATSELRNYQLDRVDEQLAQAARSPAVRSDSGPGRPPARLPGELYRVLLDDAGNVIASSAAAQDAAPQIPAMIPDDAHERGLAPFTVDGTDGGDQWRVIAVPLQQGTASGTLLLASDLGEVDATVRRLVRLQVAIGVAVLAGITGLGFLLVRSSLRGLVEVEEAAAAVAAGQLDRRVPARDPRTEIGSLATSFNRMVTDVQSAFAARTASEERLRRFVADASHELRTPLTSIRGFAELHRQGAVSDPDDVVRLLRRIEDEAKRMGLLVEDLLTLARLDQQRPLLFQPVDITGLAADAVHDAQAVQPDRLIALDVAAPVVVRGDEARLRQVLANLLANATQHTPATAPVRISVRSGSGIAVVEVSDEGPGMTPEVAGRVFERFYRADVSRTRASGGTGLGLSIVASLVHAHGGKVELDTAPGRGATFRVTLPTAAAQTPTTESDT